MGHGDSSRDSKASKSSRTTKHNKLTRGRRSSKYIFDVGEEESYRNQITIFNVLETLDALKGSVPTLVRSDASKRTYAIRLPDFNFTPLHKGLDSQCLYLDLESIRWLKNKLRELVRLVYQHGVGYEVLPDLICVKLRLAFRGYKLYLGGMECANFCEASKRVEPDWIAQEAKQYAAIDRMFAPLEAHFLFKDAIFYKAESEESLREAETVMKDADIAIEKTNATMIELDAILKDAHRKIQNAHTIMVDTYARMKEAKSNMKKAERNHDYAYTAEKDG
ncbi:hypothetical protein PT974_02516 [Cladobotryum mycophilum]|uniref:Uncharacterized protein n=1 Tax=Cladobotryum mycophilum TaxID=491253 RepID=A0ABR0SYC7_9HYPO